MKKRIFAAVLCTAILASMTLSGCNKDNEPPVTDSSETVSDTSAAESGETSAEGTTSFDLFGEENELYAEIRPLEEGDDYAINKINNRTEGDELPGGYKLYENLDPSQGQQMKYYANGKSKILIHAYNYKEDLQALPIWAEQACAITKISNMMSACDTNYSEPENITCLGFDTIKYDYEVIQYEFVTGADGNEEKNPIGRYLGTAYFFFSDQDVYAIMFDTGEDDWDEQKANFEAFINDLEITKTEY